MGRVAWRGWRRRTSRTDAKRSVRLLVSAGIELAPQPTTHEARAAVDEAAQLVGDDPVLRLRVDFARAEILGASGEFVAAQRAFRALAERGDPQHAVHEDRSARLLLLEAMYAGRLWQRGRQVATVAAHDARANGALGDLHVALACRFSIERTPPDSTRRTMPPPRSSSSPVGWVERPSGARP